MSVEREVLIRVRLVDEVGNRLTELRKQCTSLSRAASSMKDLQLNTAARDLTALGTGGLRESVPQISQYQEMLGGIATLSLAVWRDVAGALRRIPSEVVRHRDLLQFWGASGYLASGLDAVRSSIAQLLTTNISGWLRDAAVRMAELRTVAMASATAVLGIATAMALSAKQTENYIRSTLDTHLIQRRLKDRTAAERWLEEASRVDWSAGRATRMAVFQTVLSKMPTIGQEQAQRYTEAIEKYFFANQEMLRRKGITSAEQLASEISSPVLSGELATVFEDIFGLGFSRMAAPARLQRLVQETGGIDIEKELSARPEEVLRKRFTTFSSEIGRAIIPVLNTMLGVLMQISDIIGRIPGLSKALAWATVLSGLIALGTVLIPIFANLVGVITTFASALRIAAAAQMLLNIAMRASPLGLAIIAAAGLVAVLVLLEKKYHVLSGLMDRVGRSRAFQAIASTVHVLVSAINELLDRIAKLFRSGTWKDRITAAVNLITSTSLPFIALKAQHEAGDMLRRIWVSSLAASKILTTISSLTQKVVDFLNWIWRTITGIWSWLTDKINGMLRGLISLIPGGKRFLAWRDLEEALEKRGLKYNETLEEVVDRSGRVVPESELPESIRALLEEYRAQPTAGEELLEKLKGIWKGLVDALHEKFAPYFESILKAIGWLGGFLEMLTGGSWLVGSVHNLFSFLQGLPQKFYASAPPASTTSPPSPPSPEEKADQYREQNARASNVRNAPLIAGSDGEMYAWNPKTKEFEKAIDTDAGTLFVSVDQSTVPENVLATAPKMQVGGRVLSEGLIHAHPGEEVVPARVVSGARTVLEKLLIESPTVSAYLSGGHHVYPGAQGVTINAPVTVNVSVDSVSSNIDLERMAHRLGTEAADKLLFALRERLDNLYNRNIAYMRG